VEEAVLAEFGRISERGGVLGAMERGYQRGKIQDESLYYESAKHDGSYPIVGVNTFVDPDPGTEAAHVELARSTEQEKQSQLHRLDRFQQAHQEQAVLELEQLKRTATANENIFCQLMSAVKYCSLGQITHALFEVGGQYRRNM
jgi:methylmalonyl-CoA mutase